MIKIMIKKYELIKWRWNSNRNTDVYTCEINIADTRSSSLDTYSSGRPYDTKFSQNEDSEFLIDD